MQPPASRPRAYARSRLPLFAVAAVFTWLTVCAGSALHAQPLMPERSAQSAHAKLRAADEWVVSSATTGGFIVDTANREEVRLFHRAIYNASEGVAMGWTGSYSPADVATAAGDTAAAHKAAVLLRVNFFRAMAGVPAAVTLDSTYGAKAQKAALMMSANNSLSHFPPLSWTFYSADGYEAAGKSNLALGMSGPDAIDGYVSDPGANNQVVGHRRWVLYPQTRKMGTGDLPGDGTRDASNALWVQDDFIWSTRPVVRDTFVAWPPEGHVPYSLVYPRWSFSYPGADFSSATVTMTRGGASVPVRLEPVADGYGENTLVWIYDNMDADDATPHARPTSDTTYAVALGNVRISGQTRSFNYPVIVFDPDVTGPDTVPVAVNGTSTPTLGAANPYTVGGLYYASGFQWRLLTTSAYSAIEGAENGSSGLTVSTTGSYNVVATDVKATGTASFHLAHPTPVTQYFQLAPTFLAGDSAALSFRSRLGYASSSQTAHAQVSLDDGASWIDVYSQSGTNGGGETAFAQRSASLASLSGRTFKVRFAYTFTTGSYYPGSGAGLGWYVDDIALTGVTAATAQTTSATQTGNQFSFTPPIEGAFTLQARGVFYDSYPLEWGPAKSITVTAQAQQAPVITTQPASLTVNPNSNVSFRVVASGQPDPAYRWRKNGVDIENAITPTLTLLNVSEADEGGYSVVVTNSVGSVTSDSATLAVNNVAVAPVITVHPVSRDAVTGSPVSFTGAASGDPAPSYQWRKNGAVLSGAIEETLTLANVTSSDAGLYTLVASNSAGSATSVAAQLTVSDSVVISTEPASQSVQGGGSAVLTVVASGSNLAYQWYSGTSGDTSSPIAGATSATLATPLLESGARYWVRVSSPAQAVDSGTAEITVFNGSRYFFGVFGAAQTGTFCLVARSDATGLFLATLPTLRATIEVSGFAIAGNGSFSFAAPELLGTLSGQIVGSSTNGTLSGPGLAFSGSEDSAGGITAGLAGVYSSVIVNTPDGSVRVVAGPAGRAYVFAAVGASVRGTTATLGTDGTISTTLPDGCAVALTVNAGTGRVAGTTAVGPTSHAVVGAREGVVLAAQLSNISVRAQVQQGDSIMIAGFYISGSGTKRILLRGVGPTLADWGVTTALGDPQIYVYRHGEPAGTPPVAHNDDWGAAANFAEIELTANALSAFGIPRTSKDAALLLDLAAGAYTAHVVGVAGATGTSLVELYDADEASGVGATARLINISMRGMVATGNDIIIAGFVVSGSAPRRLLIRGVGPELVPHGVTEALADPALHVFRRIGTDETLVASNDDWSADGQEAVMSQVANQVSAFGLNPGSRSAGLVIWLEPGVYTAQVRIGSGDHGVALAEVYEVP